MLETANMFQKDAILVECQRCLHRWNYAGKNKYIASCPHCKTTIMLQKHRVRCNGKKRLEQQNSNKRRLQTDPKVGATGQSVVATIITKENDSGHG